MKKILLLINVFTILLIAFEVKGDFLSANDAFKVTHTQNEKNLDFKIKISEKVYLYAESIKLFKDDVELNITLPSPAKYQNLDVYFEDFDISLPNIGGNYVLKYQGCSKSGICYPPKKYELVLKASKSSLGTLFSSLLSNDNDKDILQTLKIFFQDYGYLYSLLIFLVIGILLSLTPCIFPIVPILSSVLVSTSTSMSMKKGFFISLIYVLGMSFAYGTVGTVAGIWGFSIQNSFQNPWVISLFSLIFVVLSLGLFGLFNIQLPSKLQNKLNSQSDKAKSKGGFLGIFTMGFLSALIVGACTGPVIAGAFLLVGFVNEPLFGFLSFSLMGLGIGLPLLLIGIGAGKFMPKPGAWMNGISKIFGVVLLGIAIVMMSRVVSAPITMILWSLLFIITSIIFYSFKNLIFKLISILFLLYSLAIIYGAYIGSANIFSPFQKVEKIETWTYISSVDELDKEIKISNKNLLVYFTADWCVYCKEIKNKTFSNKDVADLMKKFKLLKIDLTSIDDKKYELMDRFEIKGPPYIVFFKEKKELKNKQVLGYIDSNKFKLILKEVLK